MVAYDCDWWLDALKPVLAQFVAAAKGKVDRDFWCSIYKVHEESGRAFVTGWCVLFFPYIQKPGDGDSKQWEKNVFLLNPNELEELVAKVVKKEVEARQRGDQIDAKELTDYYRARLPKTTEPGRIEKGDYRGILDSFWGSYETADFGNSIAKVPFVWKYLGQEIDMQFLAGFCGVSYHPKFELLRAEIAWGVKDPKAPALEEPDFQKRCEEQAQNLSPRLPD